MSRSRQGLAGAGEWRQLEKLFPDLRGAAVLDLGCGYGWHCQYAADHGASEVLGIDASGRMIEEARRRCAHPGSATRSWGWRTTAIPRIPSIWWCPTWCSTI